MEQPGVEAEAQRGQPGKALAEIAVAIEALGCPRAVDREARVCMPSGTVADALEASARKGDVLLENALGAAADPQVDIADDPGNAPCRPVFARCAHRRNTVDEFGLAKGFKFQRLLGAIHLAAFLEAGRDDVVAAADIGEQILEQVAVARPVPHVMVRIDNRQIGIEDLFAALVEPVLPDRRVPARRDRGLWHRMVPPGLRFGYLCPERAANATV